MTLDATTAAGRGHYSTVDADPYGILDVAGAAVPGVLRSFLLRPDGSPMPLPDLQDKRM
ncbi:hypothetical protein [Plantactinospora sp. KLBMP9567]|uniref:hypothetical protein n=1 Tax=Plantactinospora sp. KLBMP9567 TaxID=3085900 RepID=UPI00298219C6|nr:hypothetical protein [Plantactinospora sp. KLBMP9567]MDW5328838.1 hypothetical protein [Plantactinospora sp. KLBMP9567]